MTTIIRHTAVWTGSPGLPGYTQFYQGISGGVPAAAVAGQATIAAFLDELLTLIPEEVTITIDPLYQEINDVTGDIIGEGTNPGPHAPRNGTYVGDWARQVGVLVEWTTGLYINGRLLRGRTYLVPLGGTSATDGTLPGATLDSVRAAAAVIVTSGDDFLVWHRPVSGAGGASHLIGGAVVRDHAAILRSRMV